MGHPTNIDSDKMEIIGFYQDGAILLNDKALKLVDQFIYLRSNVSSDKVKSTYTKQRLNK